MASFDNVLSFIKNNDDGFSTLISIVASLDIAILALSIPIMGERKIKIQESYESDRLLSILNNDKLVNNYYLWIMMHFVFSIIILLSSNISESALYKLLFLIALFILLTTSCLVIIFLSKFIKRFGEYESNPLNIKNKKLNQIKKNFYIDKESFISYIDLISDILEKQIKYTGKNKDCKKYIDILTNYCKELATNNEQYKFDLSANNLDKTSLYYAMTIDEHYIPTIPIKKIIYLCTAARNSNNPEITRHILERLNYLLQISCSQDDERCAKYILRNLNSLLTNTIHWHENISKEQIINGDNYLGDLSYRWYFDIVFDQFRDLKCKEKYLNDLNNNLFNLSKFLIQNNYLEIFKNIIDCYVNQLEPQENNIIKIKFKKFKETFILIAAYCIFEKKFNFLNEIINYQNPQDSDIFFLNRNIFPVNEEEIINYFFNEDNPRERILFLKDNHGTKEYKDQYLIILFLRFLNNNKCSKIKDSAGNLKCVVPKRFNSIEKLQGYKIRELKNYFCDIKDKKKDSYDRYKNAVNKVINNKEMMNIIPEDKFTHKQLKEYLYELLNNIGEDAKKAESEEIKNKGISEEKINEFTKDCIESYKSLRTIKNILENFTLFQHKSISLPPEQKLVINVNHTKEAFFEETWQKNWAICFQAIGNEFGKRMAQKENNCLIHDIKQKILENVKKNIKKEQLKDVLEKIENKEDIFILFHNFNSLESNLCGLSFFNRYKDINNPLNKIKSFVGQLELNKTYIPAFAVYSSDKKNKDKSIIILNKSNFGTLNQYQPNYQEEGVKDLFGENKEIFIKIEEYKNNESMLKEMINKPPAWLSEKGNNKDAQIEYLLKNVSIKIAIKSELSFSKNFEGYIINIEDGSS